MKVLLAPDSFKGTLTAQEACEAMRKGIASTETFGEIETVLCPLSDGGEGALDCLDLDHINRVSVNGPFAKPVGARYGVKEDTAMIEIAEACGLLRTPIRNPWEASSYGVGELIKDAWNHNLRKIVLFLGGSATNDGGVGMLQALGVRFINSKGQTLTQLPKELEACTYLDLSQIDPRVYETTFTCCADVENPLLGATGATLLFGPQKGVKPQDLVALEQRMKTWSDLVQKTLDKDDSHLPGAGAAGGLGFAILSVLQGQFSLGVDYFLQFRHFDTLLQDADLVITGEGKTDEQTACGKVCWGVAQRAKQANVPVWCVSGQITQEARQAYRDLFVGMSACSTVDTQQVVMASAGKYLSQTTYEALASYLHQLRLHPNK